MLEIIGWLYYYSFVLFAAVCSSLTIIVQFATFTYIFVFTKTNSTWQCSILLQEVTQDEQNGFDYTSG